MFDLSWEIVPYQQKAEPVSQSEFSFLFNVCGCRIELRKESLKHASFSVDGVIDKVIELLKTFDSDFVFYDIGASLGIYSFLADLFPKMLVHAFEPHNTLCEELRKNVALNKLSNRINVHQQAVFSHTGEEWLNAVEEPAHSGLSSIGDISWTGCHTVTKKIEVVTLDDFAKEHEPPDIIKTDAEGAELGILNGGKETLKKHHPILVLEFSPKRMKNFNYGPQKFLDILNTLGYNKIHIMEPMKPNGQMTGSKDIIAWNS